MVNVGDFVKVIGNSSGMDFYDKYIGKNVEVIRVQPNKHWDLEVDMGDGELECIDLCDVMEVE